MRRANFDWSEPELIEPYNYANEFGEVVFIPVTEFMPIGDISIDKVPVIREVLVSFDDAEKITLVTENRKGLMSFCFPFLKGNTCYALQYSCSNRAAVCKVNILKFQTPGNISAKDQIEAMASAAY